jgi:hypothetical protein
MAIHQPHRITQIMLRTSLKTSMTGGLPRRAGYKASACFDASFASGYRDFADDTSACSPVLRRMSQLAAGHFLYRAAWMWSGSEYC